MSRTARDNTHLTVLDSKFYNYVRDEEWSKAALELTKGANVNATHPEATTSALMLAVSGKAPLWFITMLLEKGADVKAVTHPRKLSVMHYAAQYAQDSGETIHVLYRAGGDISQRDRDGFVPLHYGAFFGSLSTIRPLLQHGADPNASGQAGVTPLMHSVTSERPVQFPRFFLNVAGANRSLLTTYNKNAFTFVPDKASEAEELKRILEPESVLPLDEAMGLLKELSGLEGKETAPFPTVQENPKHHNLVASVLQRLTQLKSLSRKHMTDVAIPETPQSSKSDGKPDNLSINEMLCKCASSLADAVELVWDEGYDANLERSWRQPRRIRSGGATLLETCSTRDHAWDFQGPPPFCDFCSPLVFSDFSSATCGRCNIAICERCLGAETKRGSEGLAPRVHCRKLGETGLEVFGRLKKQLMVDAERSTTRLLSGPLTQLLSVFSSLVGSPVVSNLVDESFRADLMTALYDGIMVGQTTFKLDSEVSEACCKAAATLLRVSCKNDRARSLAMIVLQAAEQHSGSELVFEAALDAFVQVTPYLLAGTEKLISLSHRVASLVNAALGQFSHSDKITSRACACLHRWGAYWLENELIEQSWKLLENVMRVHDADTAVREQIFLAAMSLGNGSNEQKLQNIARLMQFVDRPISC